MLGWLNSESLPKNDNDTTIVLLPKKNNLEIMTDLRPLSLYNVVYKIVSKILANHMKSILPHNISESHSAFVKGRLITNNVIVANEILHYMKNKKQRKYGVAAVKIDISKAYDKLEWDILKNMMTKLGFYRKWIELIMYYVCTVKFKVLFENELLGSIISQRRLK